MGATFGNSTTPVWGKIKIKAPSKVNAHRGKLHPTLVQKTQENMAEIDLSRKTLEGSNHVTKKVVQLLNILLWACFLKAIYLQGLFS